MSNATGKVTSDSKIKQSTGNAAATASDICLSFSIILGGLLHLSNYKELFPHAQHTTNCKHLTQSSSARDWQRQAKHKSKAHSTVKSGFCKRWISMASSATGSWFLQLQVHTNQRSPLHAMSNATGKVTSDSKIKQSTGNAAATASDICLSFSIILGGLLHLSNYKEFFPHAPHTTNCKHLTQSSSARDWQRQAKHKSKAHSTVKSGFCKRWISMASSATGSWFLRLQVHTNQRSPLHAMSNATGKVTSDSKIKQSTGNAAATASDICLSFSIILGGLLHLSNYKELFPHAQHTTNCKHLTQSSSARDWQRQAKHNSKAHSTVKSGFCKRWISMASSATGSWFLQLQVHTNQRSPIHAIGNATGKVTSAYLRFGFPHGMLLPQLEISIYFQSSLATPSHLKKYV